MIYQINTSETKPTILDFHVSFYLVFSSLSFLSPSTLSFPLSLLFLPPKPQLSYPGKHTISVTDFDLKSKLANSNLLPWQIKTGIRVMNDFYKKIVSINLKKKLVL